MVAPPSPPEAISRSAPVAVFRTVTLASLTTAPDWSTTTTTIVAVLGDCAYERLELATQRRVITIRALPRRHKDTKVLKVKSSCLRAFVADPDCSYPASCLDIIWGSPRNP